MESVALQIYITINELDSFHVFYHLHNEQDEELEKATTPHIFDNIFCLLTETSLWFNRSTPPCSSTWCVLIAATPSPLLPRHSKHQEAPGTQENTWSVFLRTSPPRTLTRLWKPFLALQGTQACRCSHHWHPSSPPTWYWPTPPVSFSLPNKFCWRIHLCQ